MSPTYPFFNVNFLPYRLTFTLGIALSVLPIASAANPFTQYAVDFPDPNHVAAGHFAANFAGAEDTILAWADEMASYGPWSVIDKPVVAPSGDKHDYMSWAPYQWPNCTGLGNQTVLAPPEMWKECQYVFRDGQVNPDRTTINDFQSFFNLSDAVLYNSISATFQNASSSVYSQNVAKFIDTWFLNTDTAMNPNLNYAQMNRGPNGQTGGLIASTLRETHRSIFRRIHRNSVTSGILMLRKTNNTDWTPVLDTQMIAWCNNYIDWLQTNTLGHQAATATNNHGTIFVNQLAGLKLIVGDTAGAVNWTQGYFKGIYQGQINSNGDQAQASRSRPYHYRNFNMAGMITNARLLSYADPTSNPWNTTTHGATIQTALDFLMTVNAAVTQETNVTAELYPNVAAIASAYGDPTGKYVGFLNASGFPYADDATFLWDQPLAGGDSAASNSSGSPTGSSGKNNEARAASVRRVDIICLVSLVVVAFGLQL
ncbi:chondroitin AC/alginate lyase [Mycena galericulata]|nr:chondroitin AC/alginate lyase [Mycena galericulata]